MTPDRLSSPKRALDIPHLAALKHRDYRFTWTANMSSGAAMWTFIVAVGWLTLQESDKSGWVGIITFASMLPFLLVSPIGGLLADRADRRTMALVTFIGSAVIAGVVSAFAITGIMELWHVAVFAFLAGSLRAAQEPAMSALIPNQVPREDLLNAITLNAATRHGARFFGLLVASPMLAIDSIGVAGVLVLSTAFQVVGVLFMLMTRTRSTGEAVPRHGIFRSMVDGLVHIYTDRIIAVFIVMVAFHCALVMSFESILPVFTRDQLGAADGSTLGYLVMGFGAGALVGTLLMAGVRNERRKGQWLIWTGVASGLTPIWLAFSPNLASGLTPLALAFSPGVVISVLASAAMGASQSTFMALTTTYVQTVAPDRLRGRISSLYVLHAGGIMAFANLGYGFVADAFSAPPILYISAVAFLIFLAGISTGQPDVRRIYQSGRVAVA